jgi:hypothetical protein
MSPEGRAWLGSRMKGAWDRTKLVDDATADSEQALLEEYQALVEKAVAVAEVLRFAAARWPLLVAAGCEGEVHIDRPRSHAGTDRSGTRGRPLVYTRSGRDDPRGCDAVVEFASAAGERPPCERVFSWFKWIFSEDRWSAKIDLICALLTIRCAQVRRKKGEV